MKLPVPVSAGRWCRAMTTNGIWGAEKKIISRAASSQAASDDPAGDCFFYGRETQETPDPSGNVHIHLPG